MKKNLKKMCLPMGLFALALLSFGLTACEGTANIEDYIETHEASPFDPSKPVTITRFTPESGGVGQQIVIYGTNFGNDPEIVDLKIGGKQAVVVSCGGNALYTFAPSKCFRGDIELTIGEEGHKQSCTAEKKFEYERKMVVGTLCGFKNEDDKQGWKAGPFRDEEGNPFCCGFAFDGVMQFSPYNHDQLFIIYDREPSWAPAHGIQMLDLKNETVADLISASRFSGDRLRTIDFAVDPFAYDQYGQLLGRAGDEGLENWLETATPEEKRWREHLIVSCDNGAGSGTYDHRAVYLIDRDLSGNFSASSPIVNLVYYQSCNGAYLHPGDKEGKHGQVEDYSKELYFNCYGTGELLRLDMDKYWDTRIPTGVDEDGLPVYENEWNPYVQKNEEAFKVIFKVGEQGQELQIDIHPSGNFAYIVAINSLRIMRTDYDWNRRQFLPPYIVAGSMNSRGFVDGVGTSARFSRPYQGTFVKNDAYAGEEDEYDFYFCDNSWIPNHQSESDIAKYGLQESHAIRLMTPQGIVRTYAGGSANTHTDGQVYGSENGELRDVARFDRPTGLVNDVHVDRLTGENTLIFYILDTMNRKIRTITMEEPTEEEMAEMGLK